MKKSANTPKQVPYYLRPDRNRTDPAVAAAYRDKGWSWNGKRYECRDDWEAAVLGYHGDFKL